MDDIKLNDSNKKEKESTSPIEDLKADETMKNTNETMQNTDEPKIGKGFI